MVEEREFDRRPNCPVGVFPFIFQEMSNDDLCQMDCVPSNPSGQLVEECEKNNISKTQHDSTVDSRDMAIGPLLVFSKICTSLSIRIFSIVSHPFFFFELVASFAVLYAPFLLITILTLIYAFMYFILFFM